MPRHDGFTPRVTRKERKRRGRNKQSRLDRGETVVWKRRAKRPMRREKEQDE